VTTTPPGSAKAQSLRAGQVASGLEAQIMADEEKSWSRGSPDAWANESFGIAKRVIYSALPGEGGTAAPIILPRDYAARETIGHRGAA
jgi:hypothetical protein